MLKFELKRTACHFPNQSQLELNILFNYVIPVYVVLNNNNV